MIKSEKIMTIIINIFMLLFNLKYLFYKIMFIFFDFSFSPVIQNSFYFFIRFE